MKVDRGVVSFSFMGIFDLRRQLVTNRVIVANNPTMIHRVSIDHFVINTLSKIAFSPENTAKKMMKAASACDRNILDAIWPSRGVLFLLETGNRGCRSRVNMFFKMFPILLEIILFHSTPLSAYNL